MAATVRATVELSSVRCAAYVILAAFALSPLLWASVPPLVDYPNHLARMWILVQNGKISELASNYVIHWRLVPNLAMDLIVPSLSHLMSVEVAGRVFIAITILGLFGGTLALHRALHDRIGIWPICSLPFVYNAALYWGFLNFLFGLGMFLFAFGGWIATREWSAVRRLGLFSLAAAALMVLHLFAFGLYGLSVMSYEFGRRFQGWRLSRTGLISLCAVTVQFIPALLLWEASLSDSGRIFNAYGSLPDKQYAMSAPWTFGPASLTLDTLMKDVCGVFLIFAIATRSLKLVPEMRWPLVAMGVTALLMPNWLSGSWAADIRLPIAMPFVIIASTQPQSAWRRTLGAFAVSFAVLFGVRIWSVTESWRSYDREFAEFRAAARVIPPGARLLVVQDLPMPKSASRIDDISLAFTRRWDPNYWHMPALAVIDRAAFVPYLFTGWTPVQVSARNNDLFQTVAIPLTTKLLMESADPKQPAAFDSVPNVVGELPYFGGWPNHFDYVLRIDPDHAPELRLPALQLAAGGSFFEIYRVIRP